jgi:hypothetical protein
MQGCRKRGKGGINRAAAKLLCIVSTLPTLPPSVKPVTKRGSRLMSSVPTMLITRLGCLLKHPGSNNSTKRRGGNFFCPSIFCSLKYHKIVNNFIFEQVKKILLTQTLIIIVLFNQKSVIKLSKIWVWDPGSGKNLLRIPDHGSRVKKAPDPGSWTPDPDPQHCFHPIEETCPTPTQPIPSYPFTFVFNDKRGRKADSEVR